MQEMQVVSLGQEDPLENEIVTLSSVLVWEILWTEKTGKLQSMDHKKIRPDLATQQ